MERFNSWMPRMLEYGFDEGVDYIGCKVFNTLARQELDDFALTLDTAKEVSMLHINRYFKHW
ncbi:antA/AntB antirepressor family protein [Sphingobacterium endophyticum]|uniref:antA/AntB antirepressor family protein n=1 Tax=Sphingobacterium endophyticum TaxID=2546448 RepID=UPI003744731A